MTLKSIDEYGPIFQMKVISSLLTHKEFLQNINDVLDDGDFSNPAHKWIINEILIKDSYSWYKKIGQGMGGAIILANEMNGYTISDRGTWLSSNKKENLKIICENQPPLINQYSIISVNPKINSNIKSRDSNIYIKWIISNEGKKIINSFRKNNKQLFFFNHHYKKKRPSKLGLFFISCISSRYKSIKVSLN